ncbi:hypothetical protein QAD02_003893 [Eretmocerus hayati]|uniref:Uncharacterized protein n=1 Tax=Eretmocerus hayati TaxID=131215 RepID=A0ACC2NQQ4_9HYME|nr:hypothetical protein QAD02_003893 [Eretmocerus hayati]
MDYRYYDFEAQKHLHLLSPEFGPGRRQNELKLLPVGVDLGRLFYQYNPENGLIKLERHLDAKFLNEPLYVVSILQNYSNTHHQNMLSHNPTFSFALKAVSSTLLLPMVQKSIIL